MFQLKLFFRKTLKRYLKQFSNLFNLIFISSSKMGKIIFVNLIEGMPL